jgi:hypothetical protein
MTPEKLSEIEEEALEFVREFRKNNGYKILKPKNN